MRSPRAALARRLPFLLVATVLALLAVGCGGSDSASTATGGAAAADAGETLVVGLSRQLAGLDPANSGSPDGEGNVYQSVYSALTIIDEDEQLRGDLATSWRQDSDTQWTFELRPNASFSNGKPLDAEVVAWNFERILDPRGGFTQGPPLGQLIREVRAVGATTVRITTTQPYLDLPNRLTSVYFLEPSFVASHNPRTEVLGSGPYVATAVDLENGVKLEANPDYYGEQPAFRKAEFKVVADEAARIAALKSGEVDVAIQLNPETLTQFEGGEYRTGLETSPWVVGLRFNETSGPIADVRVRQALNYAVDKAAIARSILRGSVEPLPGQIAVEGYDEVDPDLSAYPHDPAKARALLAEAGHADGLQLELALSNGTYIAQDAIAQVVAAQLAEVGIELSITRAPYPAWVQRVLSDDAAPLTFIGFVNAQKSVAENLAYYARPNPLVHYDDRELEQAVVGARKARTRAQQSALIARAQRRLHDNPHELFLFPQPLTYVVREGLEWTPRGVHWLRPSDFRKAGA